MQVFADADLDAAVAGAARAGFTNQGQVGATARRVCARAGNAGFRQMKARGYLVEAEAGSALVHPVEMPGDFVLGLRGYNNT